MLILNSLLLFWATLYVITAADLQVANAGNEQVKFADDTYLVIPAENIHTRRPTEGLEHVETWARNNNLSLLISLIRQRSSL